MARIRVEEPDNGAELQEVHEALHRPRRKISASHLAVALLILVVVLFLGFLLNDRRQLRNEVEKLSTTQAKTDTEAEDLKREVGQLIELPADEIPTIATVQDATKVQGQEFFASTQNGDKVLIFTKAGKAILYRPSTKKIIEVAPLNLNNDGTQNKTP